MFRPTMLEIRQNSIALNELMRVIFIAFICLVYSLVTEIYYCFIYYLFRTYML